MKRSLPILLFCIVLCILLSFCTLALSEIAEDAAFLYPARDGQTGKWGYINRDGAFVIAPQWDGAETFRGDVACVTNGSLEDGSKMNALIDASGAYATPWYSMISGEQEIGQYYGGRDTGIYMIGSRTPERYLCGLYDIPSHTLIEPTLDGIDPWVDPDEALVPYYIEFESAVSGWIDRTTGEVLAAPEGCVTDVWHAHFHEGYAAVRVGQHTRLMDRSGAYLPMPEGIEADEGHPFSEGLAAVKESATGRYGFLDQKGKLVIAPRFQDVDDFHQGVAWVKKDDVWLWGLIDKTGALLCDYAYQWTWASAFQGEITVMERDGAWVGVKKDGSEVFVFDEPELIVGADYGEQNMPMANGLSWIWNHNGEKGLINSEGEIVVSPTYWVHGEGGEALTSFVEGMQYVMPAGGGKYGYLDDSGALVIPFQFDEAGVFDHGLAMVTIDNRMAYIDKTGALIYQEK